MWTSRYFQIISELKKKIHLIYCQSSVMLMLKVYVDVVFVVLLYCVWCIVFDVICLLCLLCCVVLCLLCCVCCIAFDGICLMCLMCWIVGLCLFGCCVQRMKMSYTFNAGTFATTAVFFVVVSTLVKSLFSSCTIGVVVRKVIGNLTKFWVGKIPEIWKMWVLLNELNLISF